MKVDRRSFISNSCKACGGFFIAGSLASTLESCSTLPVYKTSLDNQLITIPLAEMQVLTKKIVRATNLEYDILLIKKSESEFRSLILKCTHEDWLLSAGEKSINCTAHGSVFDFDGKVLIGPAINPLNELYTKVENNTIKIKVI
ncbi:MAG: Rieske (2Fe-2S) protein [Bacteroidetes bacterium]|nr:Rieske (2Fe-2S) protein [Bacteroidota bacterium]